MEPDPKQPGCHWVSRTFVAVAAAVIGSVASHSCAAKVNSPLANEGGAITELLWYDVHRMTGYPLG